MEKNKKSSFTIIELIIVISIILFSTFTFIVNFNKYNNQIKLKNESKKFVEVFELTKKRSLTSQLYDKNCANFSGYKIKINSQGSGYVVEFGCLENFLQIGNYDLSFNNVFVLGQNSVFYFPPSLDGLNINNSTIRFKNLIINECVDVFINEKGVIKINEQFFSC